jgi:LCP family protein required for cell wall assembly
VADPELTRWGAASLRARRPDRGRVHRHDDRRRRPAGVQADRQVRLRHAGDQACAGRRPYPRQSADDPDPRIRPPRGHPAERGQHGHDHARTPRRELVDDQRDVRAPRPDGRYPVARRAYSIGGPNLVVKTLQQNIFPELLVNHIVDINFAGFEDLVNAIGCVYTQIDHRYYNNTALTDYSSIDIQPGYQKLCGTAALSYVRFRHTDNDLVREARQQDFIREAKDQYGQTNLIDHRDKLLKIFGEHTQTDPDLHTIDGLINLFKLVAFSDGHTIKQIPFPTADISDVVGSEDYVTADTGAEQSAFDDFMAPTVAAPSTVPSSAPSAPVAAKASSRSARAPTAGLIPDLKDGRLQAAALGNAGMPVYVPRLIAAGSEYCSGQLGNCPSEIPTVGAYPRKYMIRTQQHIPEAAYQMTVELNATLGEYYDVQGMTWQRPPILTDPTEVRVVGHRRLDLYFEGAKLDLVAWHTHHGVYWISNTLTDNLDKQQMIGLAASLVPVP